MSEDLASLIRVARFTLRLVNVYIILYAGWTVLTFPWHLM